MKGTRLCQTTCANQCGESLKGYAGRCTKLNKSLATVHCLTPPKQNQKIIPTVITKSNIRLQPKCWKQVDLHKCNYCRNRKSKLENARTLTHWLNTSWRCKQKHKFKHFLCLFTTTEVLFVAKNYTIILLLYTIHTIIII